MNQNALLAAIIGVCAILLAVGFVFSTKVTDGISAAAHTEATQQSPVPTPAAWDHAKPAASAAKPAAPTHHA